MRASPCKTCPHKDRDKNDPGCVNCALRLEYVASLGDMTHSVPDQLGDMGLRRTAEEIKEKASMKKPDVPVPPPPGGSKNVRIARAEKYIKDLCEHCGVNLRLFRDSSCKVRKITALRTVAAKALVNDMGLKLREASRIMGVSENSVVNAMKRGETKTSVAGSKIVDLGTAIEDQGLAASEAPIPDTQLPTPDAQAQAPIPQTRDAELNPIDPKYHLVLDFTLLPMLMKDVVDIAKKEFRTPENQIMYWLRNNVKESRCEREK